MKYSSGKIILDNIQNYNKTTITYEVAKDVLSPNIRNTQSIIYKIIYISFLI